MNNITRYASTRRFCQLLALLWLLVGSGRVLAQSGQYGNEWIVPGQRYFKVKIVKDGLYKLDYQYLTRAGISGVVPNELQIWRRGRQLATYVGGNRNVLDPTSYVEFYAVHNDGQLDAPLYKNAADQPHQYYSLYTDTASYFVTWRAGTVGRHMQEPVASGGLVHPHRLRSRLKQDARFFVDFPGERDVYLPWIQPAEGFIMDATNSTNRDIVVTTDSVSISPVAAATLPKVEICLFGAVDLTQRSGGVGVVHRTQVFAVAPGGAERLLGVMNYVGLVRARQTFTLEPTDISATGTVVIKMKSVPPVATNDYSYLHYVRLVVPQANVWYSNRNRILFENDSTLAGPATYEIANVPASVAGFDLEDLYNVQRVAGTAGASAGLTRFVFPGATASATHSLLLADEATAVVPANAKEVKFRTINPATATFIIVTHPQLMRPATGTSNAAQSYAAYRASAAGGRYDTLMVTTQQLYDQFHYGERSWLALRHFARWMAAANAGRDRYLMLLGKGIVPSEPVGGAYFARNGEFGLDLVPTSSRAVSDNLLTADYPNDDFVAKLHTGRLTATTPQQIMNYLNKVKTHDSLGPAPWRKNFLHLAGAKPGETADFIDALNVAKKRIERPLLGGKVVDTQVITNILPVKVDISSQLNAGLSVIDYFGHGSNNVFFLDFGAPSTAPNYNNPGKYPVLLLNGCAGNATTVQTYTIVEDYLFADQKGAIGSLGESGFSFAYPLSLALDSLHKLMFNDPAWYGRPVTAVHDESVRRLQHSTFFNNDSGVEQLLCTNWQGDPTIAIYSPPLPDFVASPATLAITPAAGQGPVKASSTNFVLSVGVANPGKITSDSVRIRVTRIFPSGQGIANQVLNFARRQAWGPDTTYAFTIPNVAVGLGGTSTIRVELDPTNRVTESNENNNTAQIDFSFLQGGIAVVNPTEFAISATATPRLTIQSNNPAETMRGYEFELDTDPAFGSAAPIKQRTTITAGVLAEWQPTLPTTVAGRDSVVWYWRARFQTTTGTEDGSWVTSSFRVIPNSPEGWSQSHHGQFKRDTRTGVDVSMPNGTWAFTFDRVPLALRTAGGGLPRSTPQFVNVLGAGIYLQSAGIPIISACGVRSPNLLIAVYNGASLRPVAMPTAYQRCGQAPNNFYYFSTADPASTNTAVDTLDNLNYSATRQQQLNAFLTDIPVGAYVAVVSTNRLRYSLLPAALKTRLQTLLGSQLITQLNDGEPLALVGQKLTATTGRLVQERGPNRALSIPGYNQRVELLDTLQRPSSSGRVVSTQIGPARQWLNLFSSIKTLNGNGKYTLNVVGIDALGAERTVLPNVTVPPTGQLATQSLAGVSATTYPYLRLELALSDTVTRIPPQLRQWLVTSRGLPEGVVQRDAVPANTYNPAALQQQAVNNGYLTFPVKFKNVSTETFTDSLRTRVQLRNQSNRVVATQFYSTVAPLPGQVATINVTRFNMVGQVGTFTVEVVVNPRLQPEQNYANNELNLQPFTVIDNNVPPTLDVAFDGRHILNGELVSSTPVIVVQLTDEDKLRHITDPSAFTLTLLRPGQTGAGTPVVLTGNNVHFSVDTNNGSVARLTYEPGLGSPLDDGTYTLRVQGRDPSNASAAAQDFQVKFEVVKASTITNLYPYPNPVVSKARFVFTVTGHELPRNMKIQIMSLTGRVVREIFMSELGPLHIGNNITDYAWDGTDSYGDRLANGTYLYRVAYDDSNVQFTHRDTAGDKAFKNDWGKLVLMR
jgi:hypothetical protein